METQFRSQGEDSDDQLWEADCILDERGETAKGEYLVKWVGFDPKTGESWEPTWERRDGVTPLLAKEWKAKKKADPGLIGVEGKKLLAEQKRMKEEERRKKREARLAKSKTGRERLIGESLHAVRRGGLTQSASSEVVDLAKSRSPTVDDETNFPGRKTKRSSRVGTTEKDIPVKKSKKVKNSAVPSSTSSSKNVPVVELPLRPRISALAFETEQEDAQDLTNGALPLDDSEDRLMRLYTNDEDFDADVKVEVEEATISPPSTNKRSAPVCSSPADHLVTGRQKRIRIDSADTAIESSLNETMIPAKLAARGGPKSSDTLELTPNGTNDEEAVVYAPTSSTAKGDSNVKNLAPVLLPSDSQFRALLPGSSESSQITTSTGPGQSQSDPIQQFISPDRVSHRKSAVSAITAGPSKLAKGVRVLVVDGEEVLGVDTDSESEGGPDPESAQKHDVATDADVVDEILASFQVGSLVGNWGCMLMRGIACFTRRIRSIVCVRGRL